MYLAFFIQISLKDIINKLIFKFRTMLNISVKLEVSESNGHHTFDLDDLGVTKQEWDKMSESEKHDTVEKAVFDLPEQPYWMVGSFDER